ncbi:MAG: cytochrome c [Chitinivibrionales bacterium]|nr:cytochrome c [Chitinivibrionales bacterium]
MFQGESFMKKPSRIVISVLSTIAVLAIIVLIFIFSGLYNIAATEPHNPLIGWAFSTIQERSIKTLAPDDAAVQASEELFEGYQKFSAMCVLCHGSPTRTRWEPARYMLPQPPNLKEEAAEWSLAELVWIVEHGLKMTGMPAFGPSHSPDEIIQIATFVDTLPGFSVSEYKEFTRHPPTEAPMEEEEEIKDFEKE